VTRLRLALLVLLASLAVAASPADAGLNDGASRAIAMRADLSRAILAEVNAVRTQRGLQPLRPSGGLGGAAQQHSVSMARKGFFSHDSLDGSAFSARIKRFYPAGGFREWRVGENLLWASPDVTPAQAVRAWLNSPAHRRILLMPEWREIGLGAIHGASVPGDYGGREVTIVTADFGARSR
jgi:uncharacterized protein YkwD